MTSARVEWLSASPAVGHEHDALALVSGSLAGVFESKLQSVQQGGLGRRLEASQGAVGWRGVAGES